MSSHEVDLEKADRSAVRQDRRTRLGVRRAALVACVGVAFAVAAASAWAAPVWLAPVDLSASGRNAIFARVAMDAAGDSVVVWQRYNGRHYVVQAATRPAGGAFSAAVDLSASGQAAELPRVAIDAAGDAVAVWRRSNGRHFIVQATVRAAGGGFGAPVDLSAPGQNAQTPQVALDPAGDAVVVWRRSNGRHLIVQAALRPASGSFGAPVDVSAPGHDAYDPQVAADAAGEAVAVWRQLNGRHFIVQAALRPAGGSFGSPVNLSAAGENASSPQVAVDAAGDAVAVWHRSNGRNSIVQAVLRPVGGSFGIPVDLSERGRDALNPQVAMDPAGDAVAVWQRSNGSNYIVQAALRPAGGSFGAPMDLSSPRHNATIPQVAMDQAGDAVVAWQRSSGTSEVVQAAARRAGASFARPINLSAANQISLGPQVAMDQAGDAVAVWQRLKGMPLIVQAAGYDFAGPQLRGLSMPLSGTTGNPVSFRVSPLDVWSGVASTTWSFGDGHSASGTVVTHTYNAPGTYRVTVIARDGNANTTTASGVITITAPPSPPPPVSPAAPSVSIKTPSQGAAYAPRQVVATSFSCSEGARGPGLASCLDQRGRPSDAPLDTATPGSHTLTVTATSRDGLSTSQTVSYTVRRSAAVRITGMLPSPLRAGCAVETGRDEREVTAVSADATCRHLRLTLAGVIETDGKIAAAANGTITVTYKVKLPRGSAVGRARAHVSHGRWRSSLVLPGINLDPVPPSYLITVRYNGQDDLLPATTSRRIRLESERADLNPHLSPRS